MVKIREQINQDGTYMQFIGEIISSVNEINNLPSHNKTETAPVEPDKFQQMLDRSIVEHKSSKDEKKSENTKETQNNRQKEQEKNSYKEKDISEKKNEPLARNESKETSAKKTETTDKSQKITLIDAGAIKPEAKKSISPAQADLKDPQKPKKKDLTIDKFDEVMKDLDTIINNLKTTTPETSKLKHEFENIKETLNKSIQDGLVPDLKKLTRLLELIKQEIVSQKTDTHERLPQLNLFALEKKIHEIEKKLDQKRHHTQDKASNDNNSKITAAVIEQGTETIQKDKGEGFSSGREKQGHDNNLNISSFKSPSQLQSDKAFNSIKTPVDIPRFREQMDNILDRAKVVVKDNRNAAFTLKLHPRELGAVNIHLGLEQGVLNGRFLVDTPEARTLLMQNLEMVRQELAQSGVSVGEFQVDVRQQQFQNEAREEDTIHHSLADITQKEPGTAYDIQSTNWHSGSINMVI